MNHPALCTIIAKNYLAFARTLAQSFLGQYPAGKIYVLIVDDFEGYIDPGAECFEIVRLLDLKLPNVDDLCFKYDLKELCTATKARLLEYLIEERSEERLIYLDPDILITGSLDGIYESLATHDIVLTPHLDTDYPDDDLLPNDGHVLRAGQFNLGFIGVNSTENTKAFLAWWKGKLYRNCVIDVANGYFVDQKFIDFVPILFERVLIEKDPGYNVAYWNLHSRRLSVVNDAWRCNNGPLHFFHFSGFDPNRPAISSHIPDSLARYRLAKRKDLQGLFEQYRKLLIESGFHETTKWPYTFDYFKSGERVPQQLRSYHGSLPASDRRSDPFNSDELKRQVVADLRVEEKRIVTSTSQLNAILDSRAWRWVSRYGRFKNRYLAPAFAHFGRLLGTRH